MGNRGLGGGRVGSGIEGGKEKRGGERLEKKLKREREKEAGARASYTRVNALAVRRAF